MTPKISVIVPVYNSEKYLRRCLHSIQKQQFTDFEVIIIDDGSTDCSPQICDEIVLNDKRFKVIHKINEGVSIARNQGLDIATGKWIVFIDSDDEISTDYLTIPTEMEDCDVIQKSFFKILPNNENIISKVQNKIIKKKEDIQYYWINKRTNALWNKIISQKIIGNNRFIPHVKISEDFLFFTSIIPNIKKYGFCEIGYYYYYIHEQSAMNKFHNDIRNNINITFEHIEIIRNLGLNEQISALCNALIYSYFTITLWRLRKYLTPNEKDKLKSLIKEIHFSDLEMIDWKKSLKLTVIKIYSFIQ